MKMTFRYRSWFGRFVVLCVSVLVITACTDKEAQDLLTPIQPTSDRSSAAPSTPPPISIPAATARPLVEPQSEPGIYVNNTMGVSLEYPPDWDIITIDESEAELLGIVDPELQVFVFLQTFTLREEDVFEEVTAELFDDIPIALDLDEVIEETTGIEYTL
ncbi:MAG: hypothetical protein GTO14_09625, partial [Anaerolineales bacterium]|nr:hypothetical protein [Anaerolineales bacterium]